MSALTKAQAEALWDGLRENLLAVEDGIRQIITTRAWEPLGYESFAECWQERLSDVKLSKELRAVVVYAMFEDDATPADAARAVAGTGVVEVRALHAAWSQGMDARDAAYITRPGPRRGKSGTMSKSLNIPLAPQEMERLSMIAAAEGTSKSEFAHEAVVRALLDYVPRPGGVS